MTTLAEQLAAMSQARLRSAWNRVYRMNEWQVPGSGSSALNGHGEGAKRPILSEISVATEALVFV